jgi:hypothetical protein
MGIGNFQAKMIVKTRVLHRHVARTTFFCVHSWYQKECPLASLSDPVAVDSPEESSRRCFLGSPPARP